MVSRALTLCTVRPMAFMHVLSSGSVFQNVWPAPSASSILRFDLASLHQRIRPLGLALAKMEIRAFRSS